MASTNKTENYNLSQFGDSDKPSWRGDYSGDMSKIDAGLLEAKTAAVSAQNTANTAQSTASELSDAVDAAQSTADAAQSAANSAQQTADAALPKTTAEAQYLKQSVAAGTYETSVKHDADVSALRNDLLSKSQAANTYETQSDAQTEHTSLDNKATANSQDISSLESRVTSVEGKLSKLSIKAGALPIAKNAISGGRFYSTPVTFDSPFKHAPTVILTSDEPIFTVAARSVTETGFIYFVYNTASDPNDQDRFPQWTAIGEI